jgi:hypothetical protein
MLLYVQLQRQEMAPCGRCRRANAANSAAQLRQDGNNSQASEKRREDTGLYCAAQEVEKWRKAFSCFSRCYAAAS